MHTVLSLRDDLTIGIRGPILNAFEEKINIAVARVYRERRRDGRREPTKEFGKKSTTGFVNITPLRKATEWKTNIPNLNYLQF